MIRVPTPVLYSHHLICPAMVAEAMNMHWNLLIFRESYQPPILDQKGKKPRTSGLEGDRNLGFFLVYFISCI